MNRKILILTGDAGFGHRKAAEAIQAAFQQNHPDATATIANPFDDPDVPELVRSVESGYDDMVTDDPTLYQLAYAATDAPVVAQLMQRVTTSVMLKTMINLIESEEPDAVVTTYPAYTHAAVRACEQLKINVPVSVIVTDLIDVHSLWFQKEVTATFVPTGQVLKQATEVGLKPSQVHLTGLPVHPDVVTETRSKTEIREALGWHPTKDTALIVGSSRVRQTHQVTRLLDQSGLDVQIAAVAGGDKQTEQKLKTSQWQGDVHTYGLVDNLPEMMHAADFIACKAGGLIVTESLAVGLPLILYQALPGQEIGNVRYVTESGAGAWSPGPIGVLTTAYSWLSGDKKPLKRAGNAAKSIGKPHAAFTIADRIIKQL